ncbi:MAG: hypothetical protein HQL31_10260, partial [Planctomycetes bacterium]|nr:hypothetical protein [Planctomycetota bacterium]
MKILAVKAENFMRYREIALSDIPAKGIIAIQGANEAGKSTIGHLLNFAVSGQPNQKHLQVQSPIHWEAESCRMELDFKHAEKSYTLKRQLDRDGSNFSMLSCAGEILAQGNGEVKALLTQILGYPPEEFKTAFLVNHQTLVKLGEEGPLATLEEMLGLRKIHEVENRAKLLAESCTSAIREHCEELDALSKGVAEVGFAPDVLSQMNADLVTHRATLAEETVELEARSRDLKFMQGQMKSVTQELQNLSTFQENSENSPLETDFQVLTSRLQELQPPESAVEPVATCIRILRAVSRYQKDLLSLTARFEDHLNDMRRRIGLVQSKAEDDNCIKSQLLKTETLLRRRRSFRRFWFTSTAILLLVLLSIAGFHLWREDVSAYMENYPEVVDFLTAHLGKPCTELRKASSLSPTALVWTAGVSAWSIFLLLLYISLRSQRALRAVRNQISSLESQRDLLTRKYHSLLEVDFKDFAEARSLIEKSEEEELKKALEPFCAENSFLAKKNFNLTEVLAGVKSLMKEILDAIQLKVHQLQGLFKKAEEKHALVQSETEKLEPLIKDMEARGN